MTCACHGEPMAWQTDPRLRAGGRWECRVKRREYNRRRHSQRVAWMREKYNRDAAYRLASLERESARKRSLTLAANREQTPENPRLAAFLKAIRPKGG